jgi:calcineurin-like phosphoesterase family protein
MTNYYFTADTHFGHTNIIKYTHRPFETIEEMDNTLINNWNKVVSPNDIVYHLGDFCFKNKGAARNYLGQLNGKIYFIWGNHDNALKEYKNQEWIKEGLNNQKIGFLGNMVNIEINGQTIVLNHYAMRVWDKSHYASWHLYGHSHGTLPDDPHSLSLDVGVDCHNYGPASFEKIKELMAKKFWEPIDHHGERQKEGGIGLNREDYARLERKKLYNQLKKEFN